MSDDPNNTGMDDANPSRRLSVVAFAQAHQWQGRNDPRLIRNGAGHVECVLENIAAILRHDERWRDVIAFNEFSGEVVKRAQPPFERGQIGEWIDLDDVRLELWLAEQYGIRRLHKQVIQDAVLLQADRNPFHEVKDYLAALEWDGNERVRYWLRAYLGADQGEYSELVGTKFLLGAVARILASPAPCKVDNVLILEGAQGAGKSTALKILFSPWFTDAAFEIGSTDGNLIIRGMWGVELAELDSFNRAETSKSKAFFTREADRYRNPYGKKPVNVVRQCVFAGSVNHATYLKDDSGNRRYWPVGVGNIDLKELAADRDQLWAEAVELHKRGIVHYVRAQEAAIFTEQQELRYVGDGWEERIFAWLEGKTADNVDGPVQHASISEILMRALHLEVGKWSPAEQQRVGRIMTRLGWRRTKIGAGDERQYVYKRPERAQT